MSLRSLTVCGCAICFVVVLACAQPAMAQGTGAAAAARVTQPINDNNLVTLKGTVHPLARAQYDRGAVADSQPIRRALLLLQRSPAQETALRQLLDNQQSKTSPNYHQWLTPAQFGQQFGPADADVQTVTSWLAAQGFQVNRVSNGRTVIEFSGTAGQIRNAFHTEIHQYAVNGEQHMANASPLQIPAALAPVVAGVASLNDFKKKPLSHVLGVFSKSQATGIVKPVARFVPANSGTGISPTYTFNLTDCSINAGNTSLSNYCYALGPADFDTIYNVPSPLINASPSLDGTGQTIAIVGDSEICTASSPQFAIPAGQGGCGGVDDVKQFRTLIWIADGKSAERDSGWRGPRLELRRDGR